jgi:two-component system LytT family response regulator
MIKAVIIDDESKGIEILRILVKNHCPDVTVIGCAEEVQEAIELINRKPPDLIFLDIEMSGETGFDLLEKVKPTSFHVIFVTAHSEYAVRAFRYSVSDYLLKPVDVYELKEAVQKVQSLMKEGQYIGRQNLKDNTGTNLTLKIPLHQSAVFVKMTDIIRIEADGAYTRIYLTANRNYVISYNIKIVEEHLDMNLFMRVHRSHIVNLDKVSNVIGEAKLAEMCDGSKVKISRRIRADFIFNTREKIQHKN